MATVAVGSNPEAIAITPDGAFAYVASSNVSVIATASNTVVATVAVGSSTSGIAITPNPVDITVTSSLGNPSFVGAQGTSTFFTYDITVDNNGTSTLNTQIWNTITLPIGEEIGPIQMTPQSISVPAGGSVTQTFPFEFPPVPPPNTYILNANVGTFPNVLLARDTFAMIRASGPGLAKTGSGGADDWGLSPTKEATLPEKFSLEQNYPNPFNPETEIRFQLPEASQVVVRIFNTLGQEIRTLTDREYEAGFHSLRWDSMDSNGNTVSSGIYLYQLQAGSFSEIRKMTLLR